MKSNKKKRILALVLCMVLVLSNSVSIMAEGEILSEETTAEFTEEKEARKPETVEEVKETETEMVENTEDAVTEEPAAEESVSEATELKQEFKDEAGNVIQWVTAKVPEGAFQAKTSEITEITMEVKKPEESTEKNIKDMMEKLLPENYYLGDYILYNIDFKVNGVVTEPEKPITIIFEGSGLNICVEDTKKANAFYVDPADPEITGDKEELKEIIQKDELVENLQKEGKSTENIDDYDVSEISVKNGKADRITMEGRTSAIYGCYVEKISKEVIFTKEVDGVTVKLTAPEGAFAVDSDKVSMTADALTDEQRTIVEEKLSAQAENEGQELQEYVAYDINLWAEGEKIQPQIPVTVVFENAGIGTENASGFQMNEQNELSDIEGSAEENGTAMVEAEHFTITGVANKKNPTTYSEQESTQSSGDNNTSDNSTNDTSPKAVNIADPYVPGEGEITNEWQVVSGQYGKTEMQLTEDGLFRIQKNVIPTGTENEFYIYLNMEPVMSWEEIFKLSTVWIVNSNCEDTLVQQLTEDMNACEVATLFNGASHVARLVERTEDASKSPENTNKGSNKIKEVDTICIIDENGKQTNISVSMHYAIPQNSSDSFTILFSSPATDKFVKLSQVSYNETTKTLTIPAAAYGQMISGSATGDFTLLTGKVEPATVTDPMGEYIEYLGEANTNNGSVSFDSSTNTLTWDHFTTLETSSNSEDYIIYDSNFFRKNAYQLVYKIRLKVEESGFNSCASYLAGEASSTTEDFIYAANGITTVSYKTTKDPIITGSADFYVPEIRGLLYDVEFKKVDDRGAALGGAEFRLSGTYSLTGQEIQQTATSAEDGIVKFRNLPWGTYQVEETKAPEGYIKSEETYPVTLCYTTNPELLVQDHNSSHKADQEEDIKNMLFNTIGTNGEIINKPELEVCNWQIIKKSSSDTHPVLQGAEFELRSDTKTYKGVSDSNGVIQWEGISDSKEIESGTYTLKETKAPAGYALSTEEWEVVIAYKGAMPAVKKQGGSEITLTEGSQIYSCDFFNTPVYELPGAGGTGIFWYMIGGILLMMAAALILYKKVQGGAGKINI
ncbi:MAG: SpaA isopeptide-forming pilin-related protein [Blautia sp.]